MSASSCLLKYKKKKRGSGQVCGLEKKKNKISVLQSELEVSHLSNCHKRIFGLVVLCYGCNRIFYDCYELCQNQSDFDRYFFAIFWSLFILSLGVLYDL